MAFRRFWVKEPRHSENISAEMCYLYRRTRHYSLHGLRPAELVLLQNGESAHGHWAYTCAGCRRGGRKKGSVRFGPDREHLVKEIDDYGNGHYVIGGIFFSRCPRYNARTQGVVRLGRNVVLPAMLL